MNEVFGEDFAFHHLDLGFYHRTIGSGRDAGSEEKKFQAPSRRRLLLNMLPYFHILKSGRFVPGHFMATWYARQDAKFASRIEDFGPAYVSYFRAVIRHFISEGWQVEHLPFTPEDDFFAREMLGVERSVKFHDYSASPEHVMNHIRSADYLIASRFHAHVFAIAAEVPVFSISYAKKCSDLWKELGCRSQSCLLPEDLFKPAEELIDLTERAREIYSLPTELKRILSTSQKSIENAVLNFVASSK